MLLDVKRDFVGCQQMASVTGLKSVEITKDRIKQLILHEVP